MENASTEQQTIIIPQGTLLELNGVPFRLIKDTEFHGTQANYDLAIELGREPLPLVGGSKIDGWEPGLPAI